MTKRIEKVDKKEGIHITIKPYVDSSKQKMLLFWLIAWSICGAFIISQLFLEVNKDLKIPILIFTVFWLYFEYLVIKVYRWRTTGLEQFLITDSELHYGRTYNNRGLLTPYRKDMINRVRLVDGELNNFTKTFFQSYWVIGGERLAFTAGGKVIPFGLRLNDKEAKYVLKIINEQLN